MMKQIPTLLPCHRSHDAGHILSRWRKVARRHGLVLETLYQQADWPILMLTTRRPHADLPLYLSAGVHGDEPAGVAGLLAWAESTEKLPSAGGLVIFPLLNPWGLVHNSRLDERGVDLNRNFQNTRHPLIKAWRRAVKGLTFAKALCLHEDYDAQGVYCYELSRDRKSWRSEAWLHHVEGILPRDPRAKIDGNRFHRGILQRVTAPEIAGEPEAVTLFNDHGAHTVTFETPSEFALTDRVAAHRAFLDIAVRAWQ